MYLLIENVGVPDVECFTVLGLSTSRGNNEMIGQFGSGVKQAILLLLRNKIEFKIFLGEDELSFTTREKIISGKPFNEVFYTWRGEQHKLSYLTEFGQLDWNEVGMALREFISNAIDACKYKVDKSEKVLPLPNFTRIYVEYNSEVEKYHSELSVRFLQFSNKEKCRIVPKTDKSPPRVYRKGVLVRQLEGKYSSIFDYNFTEDELPIDECRNLDDTKASKHIAQFVSGNEVCLRAIFKRLGEQDCWEQTLSYLHLCANADDTNWTEIWKDVKGNTVISNDAALNQHATKKNVPVVTLKYDSAGWYSEMANNTKIVTINKMYSALEENGNTIVATRKDTMKAVAEMHNLCVELHMNANKPMPKVGSFSRNMDAGSVVNGYCTKDGIVYINIDNPTDKITILEELAHYYTGSADFTRDIQDFGYRFAIRVLERGL